ncbi:hypothetical protein HK099_008679, partial [Clydaea vesicula]
RQRSGSPLGGTAVAHYSEPSHAPVPAHTRHSVYNERNYDDRPYSYDQTFNRQQSLNREAYHLQSRSHEPHYPHSIVPQPLLLQKQLKQEQNQLYFTEKPSSLKQLPITERPLSLHHQSITDRHHPFEQRSNISDQRRFTEHQTLDQISHYENRQSSSSENKHLHFQKTMVPYTTQKPPTNNKSNISESKSHYDYSTKEFPGSSKITEFPVKSFHADNYHRNYTNNVQTKNFEFKTQNSQSHNIPVQQKKKFDPFDEKIKKHLVYSSSPASSNNSSFSLHNLYDNQKKIYSPQLAFQQQTHSTFTVNDNSRLKKSSAFNLDSLVEIKSTHTINTNIPQQSKLNDISLTKNAQSFGMEFLLATPKLTTSTTTTTIRPPTPTETAVSVTSSKKRKTITNKPVVKKVLSEGDEETEEEDEDDDDDSDKYDYKKRSGNAKRGRRSPTRFAPKRNKNSTNSKSSTGSKKNLTSIVPPVKHNPLPSLLHNLDNTTSYRFTRRRNEEKLLQEKLLKKREEEKENLKKLNGLVDEKKVLVFDKSRAATIPDLNLDSIIDFSVPQSDGECTRLVTDSVAELRTAVKVAKEWSDEQISRLAQGLKKFGRDFGIIRRYEIVTDKVMLFEEKKNNNLEEEESIKMEEGDKLEVSLLENETKLDAPKEKIGENNAELIKVEEEQKNFNLKKEEELVKEENNLIKVENLEKKNTQHLLSNKPSLLREATPNSSSSLENDESESEVNNGTTKSLMGSEGELKTEKLKKKKKCLENKNLTINKSVKEIVEYYYLFGNKFKKNNKIISAKFQFRQKKAREKEAKKFQVIFEEEVVLCRNKENKKIENSHEDLNSDKNNDEKDDGGSDSSNDESEKKFKINENVENVVQNDSPETLKKNKKKDQDNFSKLLEVAEEETGSSTSFNNCSNPVTPTSTPTIVMEDGSKFQDLSSLPIQSSIDILNKQNFQLEIEKKSNNNNSNNFGGLKEGFLNQNKIASFSL